MATPKGFDVHIVLTREEILAPLDQLIGAIDREWDDQIKHKVLLEALDVRQGLTKVAVTDELRERAVARGYRVAVSELPDVAPGVEFGSEL